MHRYVVIILMLVGLTSAVLADETLPLLKVGGQTYTNVTVTTVSATDIFFSSSQGMGNAKLKDLDPALQGHFHYDATKVRAAEQKQQVAAARYHHLQVIDEADKASGTAAVKTEMNEAVARIEQIVNQPLKPLARTPDMTVAIFTNGWFYSGALKPDFKTVDIRATRSLGYANYQYVTSDLNPGLVYPGADLEFNPMTKYFYLDRTVPKKKLTEAEMLEINQLYRVLGQDEDKLSQMQK
jgi:hypothetical protein